MHYLMDYDNFFLFQKKVVGHKGNLIFGKLNDQPVVCMQGRFHAYEGYSNALCTMPMKVFKMLGVEVVVLTCAAGGLNRGYKAGDIMIIKDHIAPLLWTYVSFYLNLYRLYKLNKLFNLFYKVCKIHWLDIMTNDLDLVFQQLVKCIQKHCETVSSK